MPRNTVVEYSVPMRDGVKLYTLIQFPGDPGKKYPLIIIRNPYAAMEVDFKTLEEEDTHGYAILIQFCRGTSRSEGECHAYRNERADGLDLLDWIRRQSFYNGELFLSGGSYLSSVHFSYLDTDPPDVKAAFLAVQDSERYNILYRNGFYKSGLHGSWVMRMHKRNQDIERNYTFETFRTLPLAGVTETIFGETVPYLEEEFLHPDPADPFWNTPAGGSDYRNACGKCRVPILLVTAFYDIYTGGVFDMWKNLSPERRKNCALVVTPFEHNYNPLPADIPEETAAFRGGLLREVCPDLEYLWFDHFRLGTPLKFIQKGKTLYFRLWENAWHSREVLENAPGKLVFYLAPGRRLLRKKPEPGEIAYTYNPFAPAEFKGGVCNNFGGMRYQDEPDSRYDIISFLSEPLAEPIVCEGAFELELHCRSTAKDSCFYVRLDVVRDGKALSLRDDIDSLCRGGKAYTPGKERVLNYRFAPHAFSLLPGDRLRLDVSSSCVPYFQVHTNYPGLQALQTRAKSCRNAILLGASRLRLFVEK
ncbi:MAG: CocE/NonD family hydrolase [Lentisphaeria bacterium]|nr:CocE/NonD family hydrolase [Lentisphaeria bacterium]